MKYIFKIILTSYLMTALSSAEENMWPVFLPSPPLPEKSIKDYSIEDVIACVCAEPKLLEVNHPYRLKGIKGIRENWAKSQDPVQLKTLIENMFKIDSVELAGAGEGLPLRNMRFIIRDAFELTEEEKSKILLDFARLQSKHPAKKRAIKLCTLVVRDSLNVDLLLFASSHFDDKEVAAKLTNEDPDRTPYLIMTYGDRYYGWVKEAIRDRFEEIIPDEALLNEKTFKLWIDAHRDDLRKKSEELLKKGIKKEKINVRQWRPEASPESLK